MHDATIKRFRPIENHDTAFFWQGVRDHRLLIQRCASCQALRHPPGPMCPHCRSLKWDTLEATGHGILYSFVICHHPPIPPFEYPHPIGLIELKEGIRLVSQLVDVSPDDIQIGMAVKVVFQEVEPGLTLPLYRPAGYHPKVA
jgi:uncharacterized OB-fold protein